MTVANGEELENNANAEAENSAPYDLDEIADAHTILLMSEEVLARDWLRPEEDEAWAHL